MLAAALAVFAYVLLAGPAWAATIQVTTTTDQFGAGPTCSLRDAIQSANTDTASGGCTAGNGADTINLPAGTYTLTLTGAGDDANLTGDLDILADLTIAGAGASATIIDGNATDRVVDVVNPVHVTLSGLTTTNGNLVGVTLGGGIYNQGGILNIVDSTVRDNSARGGGGVWNRFGGTLSLTGSTVSGNQAIANAGGGINDFGAGTVTITNSVITNNTATGGGGGIVSGSTLTITGSTLSGNNGGTGGGGAIQTAGPATITNSTFSSNTASAGSAVDIIAAVTVTITNSTVKGNTAGAPGGLGTIRDNNSGATLIVTNSTLSGNSSTVGAGIGGILNVGTLNLINSTLSGNSGTGGAGGVTNNGGGTLTLRATVFNTGSSGANCTNLGTIVSRGSNVANDASCFVGGSNGDQVVTNVGLGVLQNNGGPTQTHALLDGSAAIDAVQGSCTSDGTSGGTAITTDQRGLPRPSGPRCDAGAFERQSGVVQFSSPTYSVAEAAGSATITITRTGGSEGTVGATVNTSDGTATAPADYTAVSTTVNFGDGDTTSKTVSVPIVNDSVLEGDETVDLALSTPTGGATLGAQTTAFLRIVDGPLPSIAITDVSTSEGNLGTTNAVFTVSLTGTSSSTVTVVAQTANGTAIAGSDYTAVGPTTLTFAPGETSKPFSVPVLGDTVSEPDEILVVNLTNPTGATIGKAQGVGTITNDDAPTACTPRPAVGISAVNNGDGRLRVTVTAGTASPNEANRLSELRFQAGTNAQVDVAGQTGRSGPFTVPLSNHPASVTFFVRRATPGQPTNLPFTAVDSCGEWPTFVGGGPGAF